MALTVGVPFSSSGSLQGGSGISLQGSSPSIQGSSPNLQPTLSVQSLQPAAGSSVLNNPNNKISVPNAAATATKTAATPAAPVDPYAGTVFGSTAGYNQAVSDYNNLKGTTLGSINSATSGAAGDYNNSILDWLDSEKASQNSIDNDATQNQLSKDQGSQSILDMVGNGVKSGGVVLANDNAGTSSAGEALARAYGTIGRQQQSSVNNQFLQGQNKVNTEQTNLNNANVTQTRDFQQKKTDTINSIVNSATTQLAALNQQAAYASLPDRVNIDQQIQSIKQNAMSALTAYDGELSNTTAPASGDAIQSNAAGMLAAGTAPESQFNYTTNEPASLSGSGQFASSLPIFIAPKNKTTT